MAVKTANFNMRMEEQKKAENRKLLGLIKMGKQALKFKKSKK
jgi:hypothetical protein